MRKVSYAQFHTSIHIPHIGSLGLSFPPQMKLLSSIDMHDTGTGLEVSVKGINGISAVSFIPHTNIIVLTYAPAESKQDSSGTPVATKAAKAHA